MKALVLGGARSGKTRRALALATELGPRRVYLATAEARDDEMKRRIVRHQAERGVGWRTIEAPLRIAEHLEQPGDVVLVDCLTLWISNHLMADPETDLEAPLAEFAAALTHAGNPVVLVTNEVGLSIVPDNALARRFRDLSGRCSQRIAEVCDRVELVVAGIPLRVKG